MSQMKLTGKSERQEETIERQKDILERLRAEYRAIAKWRNDDLALAEFVLGIERYGGKRVPWYLDPELSVLYEGGMVEFPLIPWEGELSPEETPFARGQFYAPPPCIEDYRIVTYWEAYSSDRDFNEAKEESETEEFVKDRLDWAEVQHLKMIAETREYIEEAGGQESGWGIET